MNDDQKTMVSILNTHRANIASVQACLQRLGYDHTLIDQPEEVMTADFLILPGVGAFKPAYQTLQSAHLSEAIITRIQNQQPTLAICLGFQLLAESSTEGASDTSSICPGLAVIAGSVQKFSSTVTVPQLGWNQIVMNTGDESHASILQEAWMYYANSYRLSPTDEDVSRLHRDGWTLAWSQYHHERFIAAVEKGTVVACQFHPELSAEQGQSLVQRWLNSSAKSVRVPLNFNRELHPLHSSYRPRLIPCLDIRDGRVVKGIKFQNIRDAGDPVACAVRYQQQGADELVILDISATTESRHTALQTIADVRDQLGIALTVGGGVTSLTQVRDLLNAGADKVAVNSAAVSRPSLLQEMARDFGSQCTVLAIDAKRIQHNPPQWEVVTHAGKKGTGIDVIEWAKKGELLGAGEILLTSWDQDGTGEGYDLALLKVLAAHLSIPIIASGGAAHAQHMIDALQVGANAVLAASIFHDEVYSIQQVKQEIYHALGVSSC